MGKDFWPLATAFLLQPQMPSLMLSLEWHFGLQSWSWEVRKLSFTGGNPAPWIQAESWSLRIDSLQQPTLELEALVMIYSDDGAAVVQGRQKCFFAQCIINLWTLTDKQCDGWPLVM